MGRSPPHALLAKPTPRRSGNLAMGTPIGNIHGNSHWVHPLGTSMGTAIEYIHWEHPREHPLSTPIGNIHGNSHWVHPHFKQTLGTIMRTAIWEGIFIWEQVSKRIKLLGKFLRRNYLFIFDQKQLGFFFLGIFFSWCKFNFKKNWGKKLPSLWYHQICVKKKVTKTIIS